MIEEEGVALMRFGDFQFDSESLLLTRGSRRLELSPRALQILAVLIENAGRVVSKDDLLNRVWPDAIVEEGNLAVHISILRKALGSDTDFIETIPRRGYRFAVPGGESLELAGCFVQQQTAAGCRKAAAAFHRSLESEPWNHVAVRVGLANTLLFRLVLGDLSREEAVPRARVLLEEASWLEPANAEVHLSLSRWHALSGWQWERSRDEMQQALELAKTIQAKSLARAWQGCHESGEGRVR